MGARKPRARRRVVRVSTASNYDRFADKPSVNTAFDNDGERIVNFDPSEVAPAEDSEFTKEFYRQQMPPHYGG